MGLWTPEHAATLPASILLMIAISLLLRHFLRGKPFEIRMLPVKVIAVILLLLEAGKQGISLSRGYDLYHLPFHFCSLFLFMMPAMAFYRGKHQEKVFAITTTLCGSVFLLMLIYPALIYSDGNIREFFTEYLSFHTVLFHNLVMLAFLLILALGLQKPMGKGERKAVCLFTLVFCIIAALMAQLLKTNFTNMYSCNVPFFEDLRISMQAVLGYGLVQCIYVLIVTILHILFVLMCYCLTRLLCKRIPAHV